MSAQHSFSERTGLQVRAIYIIIQLLLGGGSIQVIGQPCCRVKGLGSRIWGVGVRVVVFCILPSSINSCEYA